MKSLSSISLYILVHQFCKNQSQELLSITIFSRKSPKKCLNCSNMPIISPRFWFNDVPSLEKLCQALVARNGQPTLNKVAFGASLIIFVTDCRL